MKSNGVVSGSICRTERPDWTAFEGLLRDLVMFDFAWMFEVELADGTRVSAYQHKTTLRSLYVDEDGRTFEPLSGEHYLETDPAEALLEACGEFAFWSGRWDRPWAAAQSELFGLQEDVLEDDEPDTIP